MIISPDSLEILRLLQITSPALPVGAYSYSEGIEHLCSTGVIQTDIELYNWLKSELRFGFITNEAAIALRAYQAMTNGDLVSLSYWNNWFSATRETEEVRLASWQMGQSLIKLWGQIADEQLLSSQSVSQTLPKAKDNSQGQGCNYAIAFGVMAASLKINASNMLIGYIHSWVSNLVSAAVRAVPFGQTTGQQIIFRLHDHILESSQLALERTNNQLEWCGWGTSLASANHEVQYSRLFRS